MMMPQMLELAQAMCRGIRGPRSCRHWSKPEQVFWTPTCLQFGAGTVSGSRRSFNVNKWRRGVSSAHQNDASGGSPGSPLLADGPGPAGGADAGIRQHSAGWQIQGEASRRPVSQQTGQLPPVQPGCLQPPPPLIRHKWDLLQIPDAYVSVG